MLHSLALGRKARGNLKEAISALEPRALPCFKEEVAFGGDGWAVSCLLFLPTL